MARAVVHGQAVRLEYQRRHTHQAITAIAVGFGITDVRPNITPWEVTDTTDANGNTITAVPRKYTVEQIMSLALDGNAYGYSYKIVGGTDSVELTSMDRQNASDMLKTYIIDDMGWVMTFDNYVITVESLDSFKRDTGKVMRYYGQTDTSTMSNDSTSIANAVRLYGANNQYLGEYTDTDSIAQYGKHYGDDITSDTATSASALNSAAAKSLNTTAIPTSTIQTNTSASGTTSSWARWCSGSWSHCMSQKMMVAGKSGSPYTGDPITITWTSGNTNKANVNSMLDLQAQISKQVSMLSKTAANAQKGGSGTTSVDMSWTQEGVNQVGSYFNDN
ncbi:phage tail protein [Lacticaseibacillus pantheris]|uniref:phage tail protein n=1 Tax=Lacticaseibacillus pantheris TaxID=171523 RepID=UPI0006D08B5B|nr:phage tail protein [Lacticaseibacillus pantheris]